MAKVIELDNHYGMTVKQTLERVQREGLERVIIVGRQKDEGLKLFIAEMDDVEAFWTLHRAAQAIFDG